MQPQTPEHTGHFKLAGLGSARLMDPDEVAGSSAGRSHHAETLAGHWFLCGDVGDRFFELARGHRGAIDYRLSAFHSPCHLSYCFITHQIGDAQHRFVLPLYETRLAQCLGQALRAPLGFSLGHDLSGQAIVQLLQGLADHLAPLLALHRPLTPDAAVLALEEFPLVVNAACDLDQVATVLPGVVVQELSVSALLPVEAAALARGRLQ